jgi:hypothetical protein
VERFRSPGVRSYSAAPIAGWRLRLIRPTKTEPLKPRRPDKRVTRHPAYSAAPLAGWWLRLIRPTKTCFQRHRCGFSLQYDSDGVVSPLKSANRSVNDKVWTPWMADRGEPRQDVESSRPQSGTREVSAVRSTDFLAGPRGLTRGARPLPLSRSPHKRSMKLPNAW